MEGRGQSGYNAGMKMLGIICEYNPFHHGHAEQLRHLRARFGADAAVVACMSGDVVQRGEFALLDKWARAEAALACGVNLVLELPALFACASAEHFARAGVRALAATGLPLTLCFGSECGARGVLSALARLRHMEPATYREALRAALDEGQSYAAAHERAQRHFIASREAEALFEPELLARLRALGEDEAFWHGSNNQLALAYLQAVEADGLKKTLPFYTHRRRGAAYLDEALETGDTCPDEAGPGAGPASASAIRRRCAREEARGSAALLRALLPHMPSASLGVLVAAHQAGGLLSPERCAPLLLARVLATEAEALAGYQSWGEGLAERIKRLAAARAPVSDAEEGLWAALVRAGRSRRMPAARVQRAFISLLLGIGQGEAEEALAAGAPSYLRVLGADKTGRYLLRRMRGAARLPVATKQSDFLEPAFGGPWGERLAELDLRAADLRALLCGGRPGEAYAKIPLL